MLFHFSRLDVDEPLLHLCDALLAVGHLPHDEVEAALGEEVLVRRVVLVLPAKVPRAERHGSVAMAAAATAGAGTALLLEGPVADVDADGGHGDAAAGLHVDVLVAHALRPVLRGGGLEHNPYHIIV